jgi:P27 family predicted phage terminase small subunit
MKTSEDKIPPAPQGLSPEARRLWKRVLTAWELNPGEKYVLTQACECLDTLRAAEAIVEKEGQVFTDKYGQPKIHPAALLVRDLRSQLLKSFKQLGLKDEIELKAKRPPGRPERTYPRQA